MSNATKLTRTSKDIDRDSFLDVVQNSTSKYQVMLALGISPEGTYGYRIVNHFIEKYQADTSHFSYPSRRNPIRKAPTVYDIQDSGSPDKGGYPRS
jgi:hypothetical protein